MAGKNRFLFAEAGVIVSVGGADGALGLVRRGEFALAVEQRHADPGDTAAPHVDLACRGVADVDHAAAAERAAVVDADDYALAVGEVGDAHPAAEGEGSVRGGQFVGVETFAARGAVAGEFVAVIARDRKSTRLNSSH